MIFVTKKIKKQRKKRKNIIQDLVQDPRDLILDQEDNVILHRRKILEDAVIPHRPKIIEEFREYRDVQGQEVNKEFQEKKKLEFKQKIKCKKDLRRKKE